MRCTSLTSAWFSATINTEPSGNTPPLTVAGSYPLFLMAICKEGVSLLNTVSFKPLGNFTLSTTACVASCVSPVPVIAGSLRALNPNIKPRSTNSKSSRLIPASRASCSTSRAALSPCAVTLTFLTPVLKGFLRSVRRGRAAIRSIPRPAWRFNTPVSSLDSKIWFVPRRAAIASLSALRSAAPALAFSITLARFSCAVRGVTEYRIAGFSFLVF